MGLRLLKNKVTDKNCVPTKNTASVKDIFKFTVSLSNYLSAFAHLSQNVT